MLRRAFDKFWKWLTVPTWSRWELYKQDCVSEYTYTKAFSDIYVRYNNTTGLPQYKDLHKFSISKNPQNDSIL